MMKTQYLIATVAAIILSAILMSCSEEDPAPNMPMEQNDDMNDDNNGNGSMGMGNNSSDTTITDDIGSAPNFTLISVNGPNVSRTDFLGKPLVIFFFGSTCPLCIASAPRVESDIQQAFSSDAMTIIGIDTWNGNHSAVVNFRNTTGVSFDLLLNGAAVEDAYDITYDRLVVIDAEGNVVFKGTSSASSTVDDVTETLEELLK